MSQAKSYFAINKMKSSLYLHTSHDNRSLCAIAETFLFTIFTQMDSQSNYFITDFSKMSRTSINLRTRTEISDVVYIPPLKLPDFYQDSPKLHKSKETSAILQPVALDKNSDFLKQKSLYRYAISRKLNRFQDNKSSTNLLGTALGLQKSKQRVEDSPIKRQNSREASSKLQQSEEERQRHFCRRNRNQLQKSSSQIQLFSSTAPVNQNHQVIHYQKSNNINQQNIILQSPTLQQLQNKNQSLAKQNHNMMELLRQKNRQLEKYQEEIRLLKRENQRLMGEVHRNINLHSQSFINEQKIENQIRFRDTIIDQLESSIKYIELENLTLKKAKSECNRQASLITKLERENKILQEKVKILYRQKTKRRNMKSSLMSECSDMSLNLSLDEQDSQKRIEALKTSQRTPQKVRSSKIYTNNPQSTSPVKLWSLDLK